jgi:hypothetical protein
MLAKPVVAVALRAAAIVAITNRADEAHPSPATSSPPIAAAPAAVDCADLG